MIHRARLFFFVALAVSACILVANFPFGALLQGRADVRADTSELVRLQAENRQLSSQVHALHNPTVIGQIAHSEYGLTKPGEHSLVVLPGTTKAVLGDAQPPRRRPGLAVGPPSERCHLGPGRAGRGACSRAGPVSGIGCSGAWSSGTRCSESGSPPAAGGGSLAPRGGGDGPMKEVIADIDRWQAAGRRVAIARVIGVEGSGPRDPGATMVVNEDGEVAGSVSGGCVEGAVVTEALAVLEDGKARVCTFGYSDDEAFAVGLTCGGTIHLLVEPLDW